MDRTCSGVMFSVIEPPAEEESAAWPPASVCEARALEAAAAVRAFWMGDAEPGSGEAGRRSGEDRTSHAVTATTMRRRRILPALTSARILARQSDRDFHSPELSRGALETEGLAGVHAAQADRSGLDLDGPLPGNSVDGASAGRRADRLAGVAVAAGRQHEVAGGIELFRREPR